MKTVIEMAREAGWWTLSRILRVRLERFAELVRADERARMATKQTEAMRLALEALAEWKEVFPDNWDAFDEQAITALREALAEQPYPENFIDALKYDAAKRDFWEGYVPEPDKRQQALDKKAENARELGLHYEPAKDNSNYRLDQPGLDPLYTSPPAQRTWVGLSDVEWMNIVNKDHAWFGQRPEDVAHEVAKLVETKLKEKNT